MGCLLCHTPVAEQLPFRELGTGGRITRTGNYQQQSIVEDKIGAYYSGRKAIVQHQSKLAVQVTSPKQVFSRLDDIDVDELALRTDPILSEALVLTTQGLAIEVVHALDLQVRLDHAGVFRGDLMAAITVDSTAVQPEEFHLVVGSQNFELQRTDGTVVATNEEPVGPDRRWGGSHSLGSALRRWGRTHSLQSRPWC